MLAREVSIPGLFPKGPNLRSSRSRVRILLIRRLPGNTCADIALTGLSECGLPVP